MAANPQTKPTDLGCESVDRLLSSADTKSTGVPYFDKTSQYTTEIKLFPVSENGRPPFWNSISAVFA